MARITVLLSVVKRPLDPKRLRNMAFAVGRSSALNKSSRSTTSALEYSARAVACPLVRNAVACLDMDRGIYHTVLLAYTKLRTIATDFGLITLRHLLKILVEATGADNSAVPCVVVLVLSDDVVADCAIAQPWLLITVCHRASIDRYHSTRDVRLPSNTFQECALLLPLPEGPVAIANAD